MHKTIIKSAAKSNAIRQLSRYIIPENKVFDDPIDELNDAISGSDYMGQVWLKVKDKIDEISEEARVAGYEEGMKAGREEYKTELASEVESFNKTINSFSEDTKQAYDDMEKSIVNLSIKIAEKIIKKKISEDEEFTLNMVKQAIQTAKNSLKVAVSVNPADYEFISRSLEQSSTDIESVLLSADENVEVGGCMIESDWGLSDLRIGTQLEVINNKLTDDKGSTTEESNESVT